MYVYCEHVLVIESERQKKTTGSFLRQQRDNSGKTGERERLNSCFRSFVRLVFVAVVVIVFLFCFLPLFFALSVPFFSLAISFSFFLPHSSKFVFAVTQSVDDSNRFWLKMFYTHTHDPSRDDSLGIGLMPCQPHRVTSSRPNSCHS